eukprot:Phypoly_transcript_20927.p1 GENE.Phypoly_transcript_20927~~Phypoly_transcript_20927.p1  ORF type:complete len:202 (+),score=37.12 Phypoly_transcript_20927:49-606(+)
MGEPTPKIYKKIASSQPNSVSPKNLMDMLNEVDGKDNPFRSNNNSGGDEFQSPARNNSGGKSDHRIYSTQIDEDPDASRIEALLAEAEKGYHARDKEINKTAQFIAELDEKLKGMNKAQPITPTTSSPPSKTVQRTISPLVAYLWIIFFLSLLTGILVFFLASNSKTRELIYEFFGMPSSALYPA